MAADGGGFMAAQRHHELIEHAFAAHERRSRSLWVEEPVGRRRMPDPVRRSAVRAVIIIALTIIQVNIAVLGALAAAWIAAPMTLSAVVSTIIATWAVLDVWVTRQVHVQRHGVISEPSSVARAPRGQRAQARPGRPADPQSPGSPSPPRLRGA